MSDNAIMDREKARLKYKPDQIKWLLIAEAPPNATDRYFYFDYVFDKDVLFVELMKILCENDNLDVAYLRQCKPLLLRQFQKDGFFLVDSVDEPMPEDSKGQKRRRIIKANSLQLIDRIKPLIDKETRIILIKSTVFELYPVLIQNGFNVINKGAIEFPLYQHRVKFKEKIMELLEQYFEEKEKRKKEGQESESSEKTDPLRYIVVDGSNVANDGLKDGPSVGNIILAYEQLKGKYGCQEVYMVIGPGQIHMIRNKEEEYKRLRAFFTGELSKYLIESPGGDNDDKFVIQLAFDVDFNILSNDQFRDHIKQHPELADKLKSKLLKFKIANGQLVVPGLGNFAK